MSGMLELWGTFSKLMENRLCVVICTGLTYLYGVFKACTIKNQLVSRNHTEINVGDNYIHVLNYMDVKLASVYNTLMIQPLNSTLTALVPSACLSERKRKFKRLQTAGTDLTFPWVCARRKMVSALCVGLWIQSGLTADRLLLHSTLGPGPEASLQSTSKWKFISALSTSECSQVILNYPYINKAYLLFPFENNYCVSWISQ